MNKEINLSDRHTMEFRHPESKPSYQELVAEVKMLRKALEDLLNEQNGPPLLRDEKTWQEANDNAIKVLYGDQT